MIVLIHPDNQDRVFVPDGEVRRAEEFRGRGYRDWPDDGTQTPAPTSDLDTLPDVPGYVRDLLLAAGYRTVDSLREATDAELMRVQGIGAARVEEIREALDGGA